VQSGASVSAKATIELIREEHLLEMRTWSEKFSAASWKELHSKHSLLGDVPPAMDWM